MRWGGELVALQSVCYVSRDKEVVELSERYQPRGQISPSQESQKKKKMEVLGGTTTKKTTTPAGENVGPSCGELFVWVVYLKPSAKRATFLVRMLMS